MEINNSEQQISGQEQQKILTAKPDIVIKTTGQVVPDSDGNSGIWAFVLCDEDGKADEIEEEHSGVIKGEEIMTAEVAAYHAIIEAVDYLSVMPYPCSALILTDSQSVFNQLEGRVSFEESRLKQLRDEVRELLARYNFTLGLIPSSENREAIALTHLAAFRCYGGRLKEERKQGFRISYKMTPYRTMTLLFSL